MVRWTRFVDWCQQPSKIKIRTFNPRNIMVIALSILIISTIASGTWLYQVVSIPQTPLITKESNEAHLIITEDTTLTEDHAGEIVIEADGVTLDGNGHTITGPDISKWNSTQRMWDISCGIMMKDRTGVTIKNCRVTNFAYGLILDKSDGNTLLNNTIYENVWGGLLVQFSVNNTLLENTVYSTRDVDEPSDYTGFIVEMSFGNTFKKGCLFSDLKIPIASTNSSSTMQFLKIAIYNSPDFMFG